MLGTEFALIVSSSIIIFFLIGIEFGKTWGAIGAVFGAIFGMAVGTHRMIRGIESKSKFNKNGCS
ncbi:MAG: hypothetical protein DRO90_00875 [Candidatus Altiarchaeales archaeon]|nr:MAG: hypothetical protein DRO95_00525 [Candidatus Altiarchaeales archaeon]RLI95080.1 MAG: hypothetical protein DRO94_01370 [Candidatus Altiarchaeales archaeon]RLI95119.1 MAG: hypothetical protein DRO90_00875 [Candidatus Altiarchaeales archaeon]